MLRFGPPRGFTHASACPWLGHPVSGLFITTNRPIQARFHYASDKCLKLAVTNNSLDRSTKSTLSPSTFIIKIYNILFVWIRIVYPVPLITHIVRAVQAKPLFERRSGLAIIFQLLLPGQG